MSAIDFKKVPPIKITPQWILERISEVQIFSYYCGDFSMSKNIKSPFRTDSNPSCSFRFNSSGILKMRDFGLEKSFNCFEVVQRLNGNCNFARALQIISEDFGLISRASLKVSNKILNLSLELDKNFKKETLIQFTTKPLDNRALSYWNCYEINKEELVHDKVYYVDKLFLNKSEILNKDNYLRFARCEQLDSRVGVKIYSPHDPKLKWISTIPLDHPFGINTLSYDSDLLIVGKGFKERLILRKLFSDVLGTQNENCSSINEKINNFIDSTYDSKVLCWDIDKTGNEQSQLMQKRDYKLFTLPEEICNKFKIKDLAEYISYFGLESLKQLFKEQNFL